MDGFSIPILGLLLLLPSVVVVASPCEAALQRRTSRGRRFSSSVSRYSAFPLTRELIFNIFVGVKRPQMDFTYATPKTVVQQGDLLIVSGPTKLVEKFAATT